MAKPQMFVPTVQQVQPRIDLVAAAVTTGEPVRVTTYRGLVWLNEIRHNIPQDVTGAMGSTVVFVLSDSLSYDPAAAGVTTIAVEAAPQTTHDSPGIVLACAGRLVVGDDGLARVELTIPIFGRISGLTYNVSVDAPAGAVR